MWKFIIILSISFLFFESFVTGNKEVIIGDDCSSNKDCESIPNAVCGSELCECSEGFVVSFNFSSCLPMANKLGDKCEIPLQCSNISSATCVNNLCAISEGEYNIFFPVFNLSSITKPINECVNDSQCSLINGACKNKTCTVTELPVISTPPPIIIPKTIQEIDSLGKMCKNDSDCQIVGTTCVDKICKCKMNYVPSILSPKTCLPEAKSLGDECQETVQCLSVYGICENDKCTQKIVPNTAKFLDKVSAVTISPVLIGSNCQNDNDCKHIKHVICKENVCQCPQNFVTSLTSSSCLLKASKEGDLCEIDKQCEDVEGASCVKNVCVVPGITFSVLGKGNSGSVNTISGLILTLWVLTTPFI